MFASEQDIFDHMVQHLARQGKKSIVGTKCKYRGPENTACAAGACIPDQLYSEAFEGKRISYLLDYYPALTYLRDYQLLLTKLQRLHDLCHSRMWQKELAEIAKSRNLILNWPKVS